MSVLYVANHEKFIFFFLSPDYFLGVNYQFDKKLMMQIGTVSPNQLLTVDQFIHGFNHGKLKDLNLQVFTSLICTWFLFCVLPLVVDHPLLLNAGPHHGHHHHGHHHQRLHQGHHHGHHWVHHHHGDDHGHPGQKHHHRHHEGHLCHQLVLWHLLVVGVQITTCFTS